MKIFIPVLCCLAMISCDNTSTTSKSSSANYEDMIAFVDDEDPSSQPILKFDFISYDYGVAQQGDTLQISFPFTNDGQKDLYILDTKTSCGCTVPYFTKEAIPPGGKGKIDIVFDTERKKNIQKKEIKVYSNTYKRESLLTLSGYVNPN